MLVSKTSSDVYGCAILSELENYSELKFLINKTGKVLRERTLDAALTQCVHLAKSQ